MKSHIYLDHAATTPMLKEALAELKSALEVDVANPSSQHKLGRQAQDRVEVSAQEILKILAGAGAYDCLFTSSATEANNHIIFNFKFKSGDKVIASKTNHPSLVVPLEDCRVTSGLEIIDASSVLRDARGTELLEDLVRTHRPKAIFISWVNNLDGSIESVEEMAGRLKKINSELHIHIDAAQGFCKLPLDLRSLSIDSLSLSAHKMGGPQGLGALIFKKTLPLKPLLLGGGQQKGLRASTLASGPIRAFACAAKWMSFHQKQNLIRLRELNQYLVEELSGVGSVIIFNQNNIRKKSPYIVSLSTAPVPSDMMVRHLEQKNIIVSSSSACSSKRKGHQPELSGLGIVEMEHQYFIRISFGVTTTSLEVSEFVNQFKAIYLELSGLLESPRNQRSRASTRIKNSSDRQKTAPSIPPGLHHHDS